MELAIFPGIVGIAIIAAVVVSADTAEDDLGAHAHPGPRAHVRAAEILCQYLLNVLKHI